MTKFDLSIVILSYNTKNITDRCLSKLKKSIRYCKNKLKNEIEVIVVDNNSSDNSPEMIKRKYPWVKLIVSRTNTGFSRGNNIGMKASSKPFILLINSDTFVKENTLFQALGYFENNPECDLMGCRLILRDDKTQISVGFLPTPINIVLWISGLQILPFLDKFTQPFHPRNQSFVQDEKQVEWAMGAFFLMKRDVFTKTGGFNESIFMYGEEVEWCKRIKDLGFKMFYVPSIEVIHLDKASSNFNLEKPFFKEIKGTFRYFQLHYPNDYTWIKIVIKCFLALRLVIFTILNNKTRTRAYREALKTL